MKAEAQAVSDTVYKGDSAKMKKITDKSWVFTLNVLTLTQADWGAISLAVILLLMFMQSPLILKELIAIALGLGSLGYSLFWMFAALTASGPGSTGAAKEALSFLAIPSAGMYIIGLISVLVVVIKTVYCTRDNPYTS